MQRLGKNVGRYLGDTIDIHQTLRDIETAARDHGWASETFFESNDLKLFALTRSAVSSPCPPRSGGLELLGKQRKESAKRRPERAERAGASESLGRDEVALRPQGEHGFYRGQ